MAGSHLSRFGQERGDIEGKAGRRRRREDDKVEAGEERTGLRRVKRRRSRMFGGILTPSLSLPFCFKAIAIGVKFQSEFNVDGFTASLPHEVEKCLSLCSNRYLTRIQ